MDVRAEDILRERMELKETFKKVFKALYKNTQHKPNRDFIIVTECKRALFEVLGRRFNFKEGRYIDEMMRELRYRKALYRGYSFYRPIRRKDYRKNK